MATFMLTSRLSGVGHTRASLKQWLAAVTKECPTLKWVAHYSALSTCDFVDIFEAPDVDVAYRVAQLCRTGGASDVNVIPLIPYKSYIEVTGRINA